jgi:hypothetical protein
MRDHRTAIRLMLPLAAAALLLAGCGSSSSGTNAGATSAPAGGSSSSPASTPSDTPTDTSASTPATTGDDFCGTVKAQLGALSSGATAKLLAGGGPAAWKKYLDASAAANQALVDKAPAEIASAVGVLQTYSKNLNALMSAAGYDITKVKATALIATVKDPGFVAAEKEFTAYVKTNCGVDLTKVS